MKYIYTLATIIISLLFIWSGNKADDWSVETIFSILAIISALGLYMDENRPFSLFKFVNLFSLFFFAITAPIQYQKGLRPWGGEKLLEEDYIIAGILLILIMILFRIAYYTFVNNKSSQNKFIRYLNNRIPRRITPWIRLIIIIIPFINFCIYFWLFDFNILLLLVRLEDVATETNASITTLLLLGNFVRPMGLLMFSVFYLLNKKDVKTTLVVFLFGFLTLSPTGASRASVAATYIPIFLVLCKFARKKHMLVLVLTTALLLVWPSLNQFRTVDAYENLSFKFDFSLFASNDMDAFSSFLRVIKFDIVTYGQQLLGNFLFFIPRSIWPEKPNGSSELLADRCNLGFDNISCTYFAEGYINFGLVGIILFTILLAYFCALLDRSYWSSQKSPLLDVFYYMCLGYIFLILRGDLLSSVSYLIGYTFSLMFVGRLLTSKRIG